VVALGVGKDTRPVRSPYYDYNDYGSAYKSYNHYGRNSYGYNGYSYEYQQPARSRYRIFGIPLPDLDDIRNVWDEMNQYLRKESRSDAKAVGSFLLAIPGILSETAGWVRGIAQKGYEVIGPRGNRTVNRLADHIEEVSDDYTEDFHTYAENLMKLVNLTQSILGNNTDYNNTRSYSSRTSSYHYSSMRRSYNYDSSSYYRHYGK